MRYPPYAIRGIYTTSRSAALSERRSFCFGLEGFDAGKLHAVDFGDEFRALRNQFFDESVMHDIALGRLHEALLLPYLIRHMIAAHSLVDFLL